MMPFAMNAATRHISPTKTPEYLAAGKPVVSTPIADVVRTYGDIGLAHIAGTPELFVQKIRDALCESAARRLERAEALLSTQSWDGIWNRIAERLRAALIERHLKPGDVAPTTPSAVGAHGMLSAASIKPRAARDAGAVRTSV